MSDETTAEMLAEIEGQADYTAPEGWRLLQVGEVLQAGDEHVSKVDNARSQRVPIGNVVPHYVRYIRRIDTQPEPQPVQVREGRWKTRNGDIRNIIPTPAGHSEAGRCSWHDAHYYETWYPSGRYSLTGEHPLDLLEYLGPIQPEPEQNITPDDVAAEALAEVWDKAQAERQIAELRSEVSHVQGLLGDERRRFTELETLASDLRAVNAATEKAINAAARDKADLQHRLDVVSAEWALQAETIRGLQTQLEAVKAELVQERLERNQWQNQVLQVTAEQVLRVTAELEDKTSELRNLQIELDALQQAPQAETIRGLETQLEAVKAELVQVSRDRYTLQIELDAREQVPQAVSDRFEEGWDKGTARAVETIAEWLEPIKAAIDAADNQDELARSGFFAIDIIRHLPHIMRTLTGLADED